MKEQGRERKCRRKGIEDREDKKVKEKKKAMK